MPIAYYYQLTFLIDIVMNHQIHQHVLLYMQLHKGYVKMSLILQLFMQETDDLIAKIKETLTQKNV
jgi:hypothetical protein